MDSQARMSLRAHRPRDYTVTEVPKVIHRVSIRKSSSSQRAIILKYIVDYLGICFPCAIT